MSSFIKQYYYFLDKTELCSICLESFKIDEKVKELSCKHIFHLNCANTWLNMVNIYVKLTVLLF